MKFYNGRWEKKMGVHVYCPREIYEYEIGGRAFTFIAPDSHIGHKGMTLDGVNLTFRVTVPHSEVFRIQMVHYMGASDKDPHFPLDIQEEDIQVKERPDCFVLDSGDAQLRIYKENFRIELFYAGKRRTVMGEEDFCYIRTEDRGLLYEEFSGPAYMRGATGLGVGECIYGLGEHFGPFVKNGQSIELRNDDGGTSSDVSYKNVPFYISNRAYGVFINHCETVSMEVGSEQVEKTAFSVKGEKLDFFLLPGADMKDVLMKYTDITGKPGKVPDWSFGLWLSTSFLTNYDEETVIDIIDQMQEKDIPLRVFHFDCCWMKPFHWCDFLWDKETFPDPRRLLQALHDRGLNVCVWINPYIAQASELFMEGVREGYFIKRENGDVWQWDKWQAGMAVVDFTNPAAKRWYQNKLAGLLDMGVDCFKTDFGERIPERGVAFFDGSSPEKMHNYYSNLYNEAVYELLRERKGEKDTVLFARSGTAGGQRFPIHWGGDCFATYEAMGESLRGGLSLTLSGYGYWSHDIGGFEDTSTPDVYKRWVAFGLLSTHSRLHGSNSYRVPWLYGEEAVAVLRHFVRVKERLQEYLEEQARECHKTRIPVMRAMVLEFPHDANCWYLDRQYMLGSKYVVAPVFNGESRAEYYLPAGKWTDFFTGEVRTLDNGKWFTETVDYFKIPLFERMEDCI